MAGRTVVLALAAGFEGCLFVLALLLGWWLELPPLAHWEWDPIAAIVGMAAVLPLLVFYWLGMRWPLGPLRRIKHFLEEFVRSFFRPLTPLDLALIALLAGLGEEALFRAVVQEYLARWLGPWPGLLLASGLFGLAHCVTLTYALVAALVGLYLGGLWLLTGNLLSVVLTHAVYDFVVLVLLCRGRSAVSDTPLGA
jgi:membrane protease YdiL (CAAX protease family)